jgi:hypothetical protein
VVFPVAWQDASRVCASPACLCRNRSADRRELSPGISARTGLSLEDDMWQWKTGALFLTAYLLAATPALPETSREEAEVVAARQARTCYVEMMDGQLKCGGRPRRSLADARALLGPGTLAKPNESPTCNAGKPTWLFKWRGFPNQAPIAVEAETGKLIECRS